MTTLPVDDTVRLLTLQEAADRLGLTVPGLRGMIAKRSIGSVKVGRLRKITSTEINRYISERTTPARSQQ